MSRAYIKNLQLTEDIAVFSKEKFKDNRTPFANALKVHLYAFSGSSCQGREDISPCLEALMLALDMIDDIQDGDNEQSVWKKKGQAVSLNAAISLLTISLLHVLAQANRPDIAKMMLTYLSRSIEGQHQDIYGDIANAEQYIEMIKMKSGSLLAMANRMGAMLAGHRDSPIIEEYSCDLGIASQLENDLRDIVKMEEKSDWKLKKKTLPVLYLLNKEIQEGEVVRAYYKGEISFEKLKEHQNEVIHLLKKSGALNYTIAQKILYEQRALRKIESLPIADENIQRIKDHYFNREED
ncbi:polyprenyl synthetase family protein [Bacillus xiapuensis]|uniref:polyprenyl synthetase family protein n=1 Tax=Bacillus xiapuensis TaxID=2014075 RepID=UPI000C235765|nr:polyprenyl synthetase family protein [Bacillus xiapuensis]